MLFFDHTDFSIEFAGEVVGLESGDIHIVVHSLLFGCSDDAGVQDGDGVGFTDGKMRFYFIGRIAVFTDRGSAGHYFGVASYNTFSGDALFHFEEVGISVEMVEVLEQSEIEGFDEISVRFGTGELSSQVDGELFITDSGFEYGFVLGLQGGDTLLLLLFLTAENRKRSSQVVVIAVSVEHMRKEYLIEFCAVHKDDTRTRIRIDGIFIIRFRSKLLPVHKAVVQFRCFFFKRVKSHRYNLLF